MVHGCSGMWEDNKPPSKEPIRKHSSGGLAICLSACEDNQTASDSSVRMFWIFILAMQCGWIFMEGFDQTT